MLDPKEGTSKRFKISAQHPPTKTRTPHSRPPFHSPVLPHESEIISELGPPEEAPVLPAKLSQKPEPSFLIDSLYFDSYQDYFTGSSNEKDVSLSDYTTDEVWNLIKLESPFLNTCSYSSGSWEFSSGLFSNTPCC